MVKALASGYRAPLLRELTMAVKHLCAGKAPIEFAPYLAGASLFALDKTKNHVFDVRPIASGEIMRRLVSKCLCVDPMVSKMRVCRFDGPKCACVSI